MLPIIKNCKIAVIGLGYVGLPLAVELSKKKKDPKNNLIFEREVYGFDINEERISQLKNHNDITNEIDNNDLKNLKNLSFTNIEDQLIYCDVFIITVPTPVKKK